LPASVPLDDTENGASFIDAHIMHTNKVLPMSNVSARHLLHPRHR
jgi:hypothetical protein